ncbi:cytochrome c peroxidase [Litorivivens lipolytica]|uniref:Cytochrome c peroxidase n=1 Tax=Litorivivens lipolytica TaxID=1524264 RepID=A0A7W4W8B4_9GAMM|nr:cytochrome c peroxidase [Litorivivens lipolytica]MBB3048687.1 cytochrome c peroxidase [Litorivivens lipolytica]
MRTLLSRCGIFFAFIAIALTSESLANTPLSRPDPLLIEYPEDEPPSWREIQLGKTLFFDPRLSHDHSRSCASCHNPELGFGDGLPLSPGSDGQPLGRHTPSIYNLAWGSVFFWDGRAATLEEQALMPIVAEAEMNLPMAVLQERLTAVAHYRNEFNAVYEEGLTEETIGRALASFMRAIVSDNSPFDRHLAGDKNALGPEAKRGLALFVGKGRCIECHSGANLTDDSFHNLGLGGDDPGRAEVVDAPHLRGAFKTPGLRNVTLSAPYMHDGSLPNLLSVLEFYNRGGGEGHNRSDLIQPLNLTQRDINDLLAFMGALESPILIKRPEIPR